LNQTGLLLVVSGPSGSGKGTLCAELRRRRPEIVYSVSATTRDRRAGETNGKEYFFIDREEFVSGIGAGLFLEYARVYDNYYGTPREHVLSNLEARRDVLLEIDIQGAMQVKENYPRAVTVFIVPPSMEELRERITGRDREGPEEIARRLSETMREISYIDRYDYVILNDEVSSAVDRMEAILIAEKCRSEHFNLRELGFDAVKEEAE